MAVISHHGTGCAGGPPQTGCGDKNKIDGLAVSAMRSALNDIAIRGRIVIGEGEIDHAPMLWIGEEVGSGSGPEVDIAVDPIEGTRMVAMGQSNALAVMAFAPRGSLLHAPDMYMKKLVVNRQAKGVINLAHPRRTICVMWRKRWANPRSDCAWLRLINRAFSRRLPKPRSWGESLCPA